MSDVRQLGSAASVAREEGIYLVLPADKEVPDGLYENIVRILGPNREVALEHYKHGGAWIEGSVPSSGVRQIVDTPYRKLNAAI